MTRTELIEYCLSLPLTYEDYPFSTGDTHSDDGSWAVVRHGVNKKGFAHIYTRNEKLCINLKSNPFESDFLRQAYADVTPAYHMNKTHWNTVALGGDVPDEELLRMIEKSYDLTKPKAKKRMINKSLEKEE